MKKLVGPDVELVPDLREGYLQSKREWEARNLKIVVIVTYLVAGYYSFASGFQTASHWFVRINNYMTVSSVTVVFVLRAGLRDNAFPSCMRSPLEWVEKAFLFGGLAHYAIILAMTWERVDTLLLLSNEDLVVANVGLGEPYIVMWNLLAISACAHLHILSTTGLLLFSIFSPLQWALQCCVLGTKLEGDTLLQVLGVYIAFCVMGFLGGRRNNLDHLTSYIRLHTERGQVMQIFRQASVPIFSVGRRQDGAREVQVELWNAALEELTQSSVPYGTPLRSVACLRSSTASVLLSAIERALGEGAGRTKRKLVPLISAAGVVWMQADVWPVNSDGTKAIIIGSDVTEFVARHQSLLHFVPEDGLGEQHRERQTANDCQGNCVAQLDPHALTVLDCSPQFNILMQRRMRGRPFLDHVTSREQQKAIRRAVEAVLAGRPAQMVMAEFADCAEAGKQRQHGRHKTQVNSRRVVLCISLIVEQVSLQVEVLSSERGNSAEDDAAICRSDPGAADSDTFTLDPDGTSGNDLDVCKCHSEPRQNNWEELGNLHVNSPPASEDSRLSPRAPPQAELRVDAVAIHLIDLSRRFNLTTFEESYCYLQTALQRITANRAQSARRWGGPCTSWRCQFCNGWNDEDEDICEVCKMGEHEVGSSDKPPSRLHDPLVVPL